MSVTATLQDQISHIKARFRTRTAVIRAQLGMSQAELGAVCGMTRFAVGAIESGERQPRLSEAVLIAAALRVDLAAMLGDAEPVLVTETRIEFIQHAAPR